MRSVILLGIALSVVTLAVFWQVGNHDFLSLDDTIFITENIHVATGLSKGNILWAFTPVSDIGWFPVTWLSHMVDVELYGLDPRGHHFTNVFFHVAATLFLFSLLFRTTLAPWQSAFVAALFALHPLHVESVAWLAERRDVLSAFWGFLSLWLYAEYVLQHRRSFYMLALLSFVLGLMSKPMVVTLPILMLLLDYWPLNRYGSNVGSLVQERRVNVSAFAYHIKEKIPFFACSVVSAVIALKVPLSDPILAPKVIPLGERLANAVTCYVKYIVKMVWPTDLAIYYPFPPSIQLGHVMGALLVLLTITVLAFRLKKRHPYLAVGWCWYLITLLPVIGLVQFAEHSMADRYTYIPLIGLFVAATWGISEATKALSFRKGFLVLSSSAVIMASSFMCLKYLHYWQNSISLYQYALRATTGSSLIHNNLAIDLSEKGYLDQAIEEFMKSLQINPNSVITHNNLGITLTKKGRFEEAIKHFNKALYIYPGYADAYNNLGTALKMDGRLNEAIIEHKKSLAINPNSFKAYNNLGIALSEMGELDEAIMNYQKAIELKEDFYQAYNNLGVLFYKKNQIDNSIEQYKKAIDINKIDVDSHYNLGLAYEKKGLIKEAILEYEKVIQLDSNDNAKYDLIRLREKLNNSYKKL